MDLMSTPKVQFQRDLGKQKFLQSLPLLVSLLSSRYGQPIPGEAIEQFSSTPSQSTRSKFKVPFFHLFLDLSFESYAPAIAANTAYGGSNFLGSDLAAQEPWTYTGHFQLGRSRNGPWGGAPSVDGLVFGIFQKVSSIEQTVSDLVPGRIYAVSWSQRGRKNGGSGNDINVSLGGSTLYSETDIVDKGQWEAKISTKFEATSKTAVLKFWTTNPKGGDRTVFIDAISITKVQGNIEFINARSRV